MSDDESHPEGAKGPFRRTGTEEDRLNRFFGNPQPSDSNRVFGETSETENRAFAETSETENWAFGETSETGNRAFAETSETEKLNRFFDSVADVSGQEQEEEDISNVVHFESSKEGKKVSHEMEMINARFEKMVRTCIFNFILIFLIFSF